MRPKTTILRFMGAILVFAAILAALKHPTFWWCSGLVTLQVGLFSLAILQTVISRGRSRACWAGFAIFGLTYLHAGCSLSLVSQRFVFPPPSLLVEILVLRYSPYGLASGVSDVMDEWIENGYPFQVCLLISTLLFGALGAVVGRMLDEKRLGGCNT